MAFLMGSLTLNQKFLKHFCCNHLIIAVILVALDLLKFSFLYLLIMKLFFNLINLSKNQVTKAK